MATLADVAALARVSKATASRAFGKPDSVSPATAQRVFDAAAKLHFVPNIAARQLAKGRTGIIALVVPTLDNSYFTPVIAGAQARAEQLDLRLTVAVHPIASPQELPAFERLSRQVDGFILATPHGSNDLIETATGGKPTVLLDREVPGMTSVLADTPAAFGVVAQLLIAAGHEHLVYVGGPAGSWQDPLRLEAVRQVAGAAGAAISHIGPRAATFSAGASIAAEVRQTGATAVIPYATAVGLGIEHALLLAGVRDLPVVSSEEPVAAALGKTGIPTIDVDGKELGRTAADELHRHIEHPDAAPTTLRLPVSVSPPIRPAP
ncbi:LacI family DNA-binding transcriptional regulator [Nesterenkonia suensis]